MFIENATDVFLTAGLCDHYKLSPLVVSVIKFDTHSKLIKHVFTFYMIKASSVLCDTV